MDVSGYPWLAQGNPASCRHWGRRNRESGQVSNLAHPCPAAIDAKPLVFNNEDMADAAIQIENLTKDYPHGFLHLKMKRSLEGLTMRVEDGEVFGFLGPNGAGKSTTIKLLVGLIFPTAGDARILGKPISDISMHQDIGYLPEQPYFYDYLTAAELLDYFAQFHDLTAADRRGGGQRTPGKTGRGARGQVE